MEVVRVCEGRGREKRACEDDAEVVRLQRSARDHPLEDVDVLTVGDTVHQALKRGDVDAVGIGCQDYEQYMADEDRAQYPVLAEGPELPPDLLVARSGLSPETIQKVQSTFRDNFDEILTALLNGEDNAKYRNAALVDVTDQDYDIVRSMYRAIGADDFSEFVGG